MLAQSELFSLYTIAFLPYASYNREQDRGTSAPIGRIALPQIFRSVLSDALELGSMLTDQHGQDIISKCLHKLTIYRKYSKFPYICTNNKTYIWKSI